MRLIECLIIFDGLFFGSVVVSNAYSTNSLECFNFWFIYKLKLTFGKCVSDTWFACPSFGIHVTFCDWILFNLSHIISKYFMRFRVFWYFKAVLSFFSCFILYSSIEFSLEWRFDVESHRHLMYAHRQCFLFISHRNEHTQKKTVCLMT